MVKVWCPECKKFVEPIVEWEPIEEDAIELSLGADPETIQQEMQLFCPECGTALEV